MIEIAGILRKSPTKKVEASIELQMETIEKRVRADFPGQETRITWFKDIASGDDPNREELNRFFSLQAMFPYAYAFCVDRFSRSWLGQMWFELHFIKATDTELRFCTEVGDLYLRDELGKIVVHKETGERLVNESNYGLFIILTAFASWELRKIRTRQYLGLEKLRRDPEAWARKYQGSRHREKKKD